MNKLLWSQIYNKKSSDGFQVTQKSFTHTINLHYIRSRCTRCGICELICPKTAIKLEEHDRNFIQINEKKCVRCGICAYFCMFHALQIEHVLFGDINKDEVVMNKIGGLPDLNAKITIFNDKCNLCKTCEKVCPRSAITIKEDKLEINNDLCILCGWCASTCPESAIEVVKLFQGNLLFNDINVKQDEIKDLVSICPSECIRYKDLDLNRIRNVKTKKILGHDPDKITWLKDFCIFCGACQKLKPELIKEIKRIDINAADPFLENRIWVEIKKKLFNE